MDDALSWSYPSNQTHWIQCSHGDVIENVSFSNYCKVTQESQHPYTDEDMILHEGLLRLDMASRQPLPWFVASTVRTTRHAYQMVFMASSSTRLSTASTRSSHRNIL